MQGVVHASRLEAELGDMRTVARDALIAATPEDTGEVRPARHRG